MMANDSDPENDELTVILVEGSVDPGNSTDGVAVATLPSGATVTVSQSGEYTYDPSGHFDSLDEGEEGVDTFTYTISDGKGGTDEATVTILMPGVNDPPMPENDVHSLAVVDGEELAFSDNALANDSDPEGDELTVTAVNRDGDKVGTEISLPSGANVTVETDGTYTYEPSGEFESLSHGESASDTFEYTVSDGKGGTEVATVTIIIHGDNSEPAAADDSESTTEDAAVSYDSILENDSDPEDDVLTVKTVEGQEDKVGTAVTLPSGATVTVTSDGAYTFDPSGQYESLGDGDEATDSFVYTISDGNGGVDEATVTIVISGRNDAPDAEDDILEDPFPAGLPVGGQNVLSNDSDAEDDDLTVTKIGGQDIAEGPNTTVSLPSGAILTIDTDTGDFTVDPSGHFDSLDSNETALVTFEYVISDGEGGTDAATVTLTLFGRDTEVPSLSPSSQPSLLPSLGPSSLPSDQPSKEPSTGPSSSPSLEPSSVPSSAPTQTVEIDARGNVNVLASGYPSEYPSEEPSALPSQQPTIVLVPLSKASIEGQAPAPRLLEGDTINSSVQPSEKSGEVLSKQPIKEPSAARLLEEEATHRPSTDPRSVPSEKPSELPSKQPLKEPNSGPTESPLPLVIALGTVPRNETLVPSDLPSVIPPSMPSLAPSLKPLQGPRTGALRVPSALPSAAPGSFFQGDVVGTYCGAVPPDCTKDWTDGYTSLTCSQDSPCFLTADCKCSNDPCDACPSGSTCQNDPSLSGYDSGRPTMCIDIECGSCSHDGTNCCKTVGDNRGLPNILDLDGLGGTQCSVQNKYFAALGGDLSGNLCNGADLHLMSVPAGCGCIPSAWEECRYDKGEQSEDSKCFICDADDIIKDNTQCKGCEECLSSCNSCVDSVSVFDPFIGAQSCCMGGMGDCESGSAQDINTNAYCCFEYMDEIDSSCRASCVKKCTKLEHGDMTSTAFGAAMEK